MTGYVDTDSPLCAEVRARQGAATTRRTRSPGSPRSRVIILRSAPCRGTAAARRAIILEFVEALPRGRLQRAHPCHRRFAGAHLPRCLRGGAPGRRQRLDPRRPGAIQLVHPDDVPRVGKDHLYLAFTYPGPSPPPSTISRWSPTSTACTAVTKRAASGEWLLRTQCLSGALAHRCRCDPHCRFRRAGQHT